MVLSLFNEGTLALVSLLMKLAAAGVGDELVDHWSRGGVVGHASYLIRLVRLHLFGAGLRALLRGVVGTEATYLRTVHRLLAGSVDRCLVPRLHEIRQGGPVRLRLGAHLK